jgi:hypothetical protein
MLPRFCGEHALDLALAQALAVQAEARYIACHCWVFTPRSFLDVIEQATLLGLFPFVVSQFAPTEPGGFEFFVALRRDAEHTTEALRRVQLAAIAHLRAIAERRDRSAAHVARI